MKHLKEITQMRLFIKKVHDSVFKYAVLNSTMSRDICKRIWLISALIQHLTHFWLGFLGLFLDGEVQNWTPDHSTFFKAVLITPYDFSKSL